MDLAAIGSMSIQMSMAQTQQQAGISILKKAMDLQSSQTDALIQNLQASAPPSSGKLNMLV